MPLIRRRSEAEETPAAETRAQPALRTRILTQELLDELLTTLEAVLRTPEVQLLASKRVRTGLTDAYKLADHLYPVTSKGEPVDRDHTSS